MGFKELRAPRKTGNRWRLFLSEAGVLVWVCVRARARVRLEGRSSQTYEIPMGFSKGWALRGKLEIAGGCFSRVRAVWYGPGAPRVIAFTTAARVLENRHFFGALGVFLYALGVFRSSPWRDKCRVITDRRLLQVVTPDR